MKTNWTLLLLFMAPGAVLAQNRANMALDSARIRVGSQVTLHIRAQLEKGFSASEPILQLTDSLNRIEVVASKPWDTLRTSPYLALEKNILLTAWDSGLYLIPAARIPIGTDTLTTNALTLEVSLVPADTAALRPIKPIQEAPWKWTDLPWIWIGAALALLTLALLFWLRRKKPAPPPPPAEVALSPAEQALQKLRDLEAANRWQQGQIKEYYSELTFILREYLEAQYGILALEQTTPEILRSLKDKDIPADKRQALGALLREADFVKFAKGIPPADRPALAMLEAVNFVQ